MDWPAILTITGAIVEAVGLGFVFIELALIRSHEFETVPPWVRLRPRLRVLFTKRHPKTASGSARTSVRASISADGYTRPRQLTEEMTDRERIERLESYVEYIDRDLRTSDTSRESRLRRLLPRPPIVTPR